VVGYESNVFNVTFDLTSDSLKINIYRTPPNGRTVLLNMQCDLDGAVYIIEALHKIHKSDEKDFFMNVIRIDFNSAGWCNVTVGVDKVGNKFIRFISTYMETATFDISDGVENYLNEFVKLYKEAIGRPN